MDTLVSTDWLSRHLDDPDLVVLDCMVQTEQGPDGITNRSGYEDYLRGHIPSAGFADLKGDLCDSSNPIEFSLPIPEAFCTAMGKLGVGNGSRVVLYDSLMSAWAARVWWMLRWVGFDQAAILDGGLNAWRSEGRPLSPKPATHLKQHLTPHPRSELIADRSEVFAAITDSDVHLIDTLPSEIYRGEMTMYARPGHIPSAINISGTELIHDTGHYRPLPELEAMHNGNRAERVITYCGGGILASSNAFVMTRLGFEDVAVYTASLQEWAADKRNPMTLDQPPTE
ncbi:MAG: sulfurtransferase [Boseongicola sp.]